MGILEGKTVAHPVKFFDGMDGAKSRTPGALAVKKCAGKDRDQGDCEDENSSGRAIQIEDRVAQRYNQEQGTNTGQAKVALQFQAGFFFF